MRISNKISTLLDVVTVPTIGRSRRVLELRSR